MPLNVRAKGVSLSTATNWAFNFFVGEVTPYLQDLIAWRLYPMHGFFCVCSFILGLHYFSPIKSLCLSRFTVYFCMLLVYFFMVELMY